MKIALVYDRVYPWLIGGGEKSLSELFGVPACVTPLADGTPLVTLGTPPGGLPAGRG